SMVILYSILNKAPNPIGEIRGDIPADLERVINHCLKKNPDARYQSVSDLRSDLQKLRQALSSGEARPYTSTTRLLQQVLRPFHRPWIAIPAAIFLFLLVLVLPFRHTWTSLIGVGSKEPAEKGLAVLPFNVIGGTEEDQRFCAGLYETLNSKLTQIKKGDVGFWLVPSVEVINEDIQSATQAQEVFNVDLVIAPIIDYSPEGVNVTLNLIDARLSRQLDSRNLNYESLNRLALGDNIIGEAAALLNLEVSPLDRVKLSAAVSESAEASVFYTQGIGYLQLYRDVDSLDNAVTLLTKAAQEDPEFALARAKLGETFWRKWDASKEPGDLAQARTWCKAAVELDPDLAAAHVTVGILNRDTGDYTGAIEEFGKALELEPANPDAHRELGVAYQMMDDLELAEKHFMMAIDANRAFWGGYNHLGSFYYYIGREADAEQMFIRVTELAPDNYHGHNSLGAILLAMGNEGPAEITFQKSLSLKPNSYAYANLATLYFGQRRFGVASEFYEKALDLKKTDHRIWGNLGDSRRLTRRYTQGVTEEEVNKAYEMAIGLARRDLSNNPQGTRTRAYLVFYLAVTGDESHALDEIAQVRKVGTKDVTALRLCVRAYEIMGMRDRALEMLAIYFGANGPLDDIENNPDLQDMKNDTRYNELIKAQQK
ncbi:MAG: tetratricopeptide repeat protein, partial [Candidatus Aminicenantaceae bacterium]